MVWILGFFALITNAWAGRDDAQLGVIFLPLTPHPAAEDYTGLAEYEGAGYGTWVTDADRFLCQGVGDFVEIKVLSSNYPSRIPKRVTCRDGEREARVKVRLSDRRLEPMLVGDGTLVMPRMKGQSVVYRGVPPHPDVVSGATSGSSLQVRCEVEPGRRLYVSIAPDMKDGEGACRLPLGTGGHIWMPIIVRTLKRSHYEHE